MRYNLQHSVENEWLCLKILSALRFDVAHAEMATFQDRVSDERVLVVERFDRQWSPDQSHIIRLPQEDFCQATGTAPADKYESDGGHGHILTPLYDVISAWPIIGSGPDKIAMQKAKLAMALRGKSVHRELDKINTRHWRILADQSGLPDAFEAMVDLVDRVPDAIASVEINLPSDFPNAVWHSISNGMQRQRDRFLAGMNDI